MRCYNAAMRTAISVLFLIAGVILLLVGLILIAAAQRGGGILGWFTNDPLATAAVVLGILGIIAEVYRLSHR
jgi:hypothetical protein